MTVASPGTLERLENRSIFNRSSWVPPNNFTTSYFLMSSTSFLRIAARAQPCTFFRSNGIRNITPRTSSVYAVPALIATTGSASSFSTSRRKLADKDGQEASGAGHHEESFEEFTARYVDFNWCSRNQFEHVPEQPAPPAKIDNC